MSNLETQLNTLLNDAAKKLSFEKFSHNLDLSVLKGDGFLGEMYKSSITNELTGKTTHVIIKKAPINQVRRDETCIQMAYKHEIFFYSVTYPLFRKFQKERQVSVFDNIPPYITSCEEEYNEMVVLEDITKLGYQMREKDLVLDDDHARFIFETYGRYHAISFALKDQLPAEYKKIAESVKNNVTVEFGKKRGFSGAVKQIAEKCFTSLDFQEDSDVCEKFKRYTEDSKDIYNSVVQYQGQYSCVLHGDCWSNNMMFKYEGGKLTNMKLLDFQLVWTGTPVYDLSYFFYSGGSQNLFKKLEYYLDIYYSSFSQFVTELGSDPEKLLPRQALSEDWKQYSKFGMLMALLLIPVKLMSKEDSIKVSEGLNDGEETKKKLTDITVNETEFNRRVRDLLNHMYEIQAL